jgi:ion channel-forming bestrophin family protein
VFRTNTSYQRWDEARKNWGMNINHTRDLVRMANAYYDRSATTPERRQKDLETVSKCTWAFVRAMKRHLSPEKEDEEFFRQELRERLAPQQAENIIKAAHRPNRALFDLSLAIENLPMSFIRKNEIHRAATIFEDNLGSSERLLTSPVPLFYSRHTARFLSVWLLLLPLAIYEPLSQNTWNSIGLIPTSLLISVFLFGIEELATQMEEPFTILPMQAFCDKIGNWCNEIVSWNPGDNGMVVETAFPEHMSISIGPGSSSSSSSSSPPHSVAFVATPAVDAAATAAAVVEVVEAAITEDEPTEVVLTDFSI